MLKRHRIMGINTSTLSLQNIRQAEKHLSKSDMVMARLISQHGTCSFIGNEYNPFHTLTNSIISQQLSAKAADTIKRRLSEVVSFPFTPANLAKHPPETLKSMGLSSAKTRYIQELAVRVIDGRLDFNALVEQDNETVMSALTDVPGVGQWTAEMFLIFALKRSNVLALGDAGLRRSAKLLYGKRSLSKSLKKMWSPYCSVASWYLWRHLDVSVSKVPRKIVR
jgi:DNA-3-methyladenine glycosylase II